MRLGLEKSTKRKVNLETHGCSASTADSEMIAGMLNNENFEIIENAEEADLNILVSCTVKTVTAQRMSHRIAQLTEIGKPLIVAGCMPKTEREKIESINNSASLLGPNAIDRSVEVAEAALDGRKAVALVDSDTVKLLLPRSRKNPTVGIVEISNGCLSTCSFCQTKIAKGFLKSYPIETILEEVELATRDGCGEIWLTSTDNGCYGMDIGSSLPELIRKVCSVRGDFYVRVGMMNPMYLVKRNEELVESYRNLKVFKFIHIPVQSGSPRILRLMKRGHTVKQFISIVRQFREKYPSITISTDLITGFPTETEEDFQMTMKLLQKISPDVVNISRYGARPGTDAENMPQVNQTIVKNRTKRLHTLARKLSLERNLEWIGWRGRVLVDENVKGAILGRNFAYKPVVVHEKVPLGSKIDVKIIDATSACLTGKLV